MIIKSPTFTLVGFGTPTLVSSKLIEDDLLYVIYWSHLSHEYRYKNGIDGLT